MAQHSVLVSSLVKFYGGTQQEQLHGLLHDATEAYLTDVSKPLKSALLDYKSFEVKAWFVIADAFNLRDGFDENKIVKRADHAAYQIETVYLRDHIDGYHEAVMAGDIPHNITGFLVQPPRLARYRFMRRYQELTQ